MKKIIIICIAIIICGGVGFYKYNVNDEIDTEMIDTVVDSIKSASDIDIENNNKIGLNKPKKNVVTKDLIDDNKVEENNVNNIIEEPEVEGEVIEESTVVENNSSNAVENNIIEEPKHEHSYSYWYEDVDGLTHTEYYKCSCGDYYTNVWTETVKEEPNNSTTNEVKTEPVKEEPKTEQKVETKEEPKKEEPKHEHSWTAVYKTVNHPAEYKTVHHDAEYKTVHHDAVYETQSVPYTDYEYITGRMCSCGYNTLSESEYDNHKANSYLAICPETGGKTFDEAMITDWDLFVKYFKCGSGGVISEEKEVTKYRDEQVCVKEAYDEQVLVKEAYDEKVLVKEAYDEQVLDYYKCNCGAKK